MDETLKAILDKLNTLETGQQALQTEMNRRFDAIQEDIDQIKEDTAITRETTNMIGEWTEAAADVLKIKYPMEEH